MQIALAYVISLGIVGFGAWIVVAGLSSSAPAVWICLALFPYRGWAPEHFRRTLGAARSNERAVDRFPEVGGGEEVAQLSNFATWPNPCQLPSRPNRRNHGACPPSA